jgi:hypothetical protein
LEKLENHFAREISCTVDEHASSLIRYICFLVSVIAHIFFWGMSIHCALLLPGITLLGDSKLTNQRSLQGILKFCLFFLVECILLGRSVTLLCFTVIRDSTVVELKPNANEKQKNTNDRGGKNNLGNGKRKRSDKVYL